MRTGRTGWAVLVLTASALAAVAEYGGLGPPLRPVLTFSFLLVCPGLALVGCLRLEGLLAPALLVVAASIVVDGGVSEVLVLTRTWSPGLALAILIGISAAGAVLQLLLPVQGGRRLAPAERAGGTT
jgi:hypothetical protein